ncbi:probable multidrug resistance-associated protein lethal(2)03659 isoform X2 [Euwallacea fornicatus]
MSRNEAFLYSILMVASPFLVMSCQHNFLWYQFTMGIKIKVAATALVYRKALKLSRSSLAETNIGQMVNLISNDVTRFENAVKHIHSLWIGPIEMLIIVILLYFYVGPSGMTGVAFLMLFLPVQMWLGKKTSNFRLNTAMRTDERIRLMNEIISGIQVIKMYTWEKPFAKLVEISRWKEMQQIKKNAYIKAVVFSFQAFVTKMAIWLCVIIFVLTGNSPTTQFVYVVTSFYTILRPVLTKRLPEGVTHLAEAQISIKRISEFLFKEEIDFDVSSTFLNSALQQNGTEKPAKISQGDLIDLSHVFVKWNPKFEEYSLQDVTFQIGRQLIVVLGPVGSGKTTLLHTILRELIPSKGTVKINGIISYASQEPWLFMSSIRQNILFGQSYDRERYQEIIKVCALERDFSLFPYGDETLVGDRGVTLSGGQKARINLARAVYKKADIYLLDDPLSAVDTHVGKHIFNECIQQYLRGKCVVLVTHQPQYLRNAEKIYLLDNGSVNFSGSFGEIHDSGHEYAKLLVELNNKSEGDSYEELEAVEEVRKEEKTTLSDKDNYIKGPKANKEGKAVGNIAKSVYGIYFQNGGHWCIFVSVFLLFCATQGIGSLFDYFTSWWVNANTIRQSNETESIKITIVQKFWLEYMTDNLSAVIYTVLIVSLTVLALSRALTFYRFAMKASTTLHNSMFNQIVYAPMRFFNTNPSGRVLNRFSSDMNQVDEALPSTMLDSIQNGLAVLATTVVVATVNPWMLVPTLIILFIFYLMRIIYISTSRDVKRVESITRSPVFSHLTASLQGLTTIRAFGAQDVLRQEFEKLQNRNSSPAIVFIAVGRCFGFWLDVGCTVYIFFVTMSFLFLQDTPGGFVGLSITQSMTLAGMFQMCIRQFSELENQMTCVERIKEYVDVVPESNTGARQPPDDWPSKGKINFKSLNMRYAPDEPQVLKDLIFTVNSKEKVGIVGRTGAGKSSIIIALFRLAENQGTISIDDVDTKTVSLDRLRSSISIIPQEPVLFTGTLRKNLDPFDDYDDEILWNALEQVELKDVVSDFPNGLQSKMSEGGSNFSVGQRQLVCMARAIIRKNKILVLDEATANVDPQTDALIQLTIRSKFSNCTVLTIAHRLHTIMDSDKVLVMDAGRVVEFGTPFELLQNKDGVFAGMVEQTGRAMASTLLGIAQKAPQDQAQETPKIHEI